MSNSMRSRDFLTTSGPAQLARIWAGGAWLVAIVSALAAETTPTQPPCPLHYINTSFENASPVQWQVDPDGTVQIFVLYDYERRSPNRAAGHWYFELQGEPGSDLTLVLNNFQNIYDGKPSSPLGKKSICYLSADRKEWSAVPAEFMEGNRLRVKVRLKGASLFLARLEPYTLADLQRLLEEIRGKPDVRISEIGRTVQGRPLEIVRIGDPRATHRVFVRARAHAWEPGGNWVAEGLIRGLLSDDEIARRSLQSYCLYLMPMANKDGVARGGTRFNLLGKDLNRDWNEPPDPLLAPENHALEEWLKSMAARGEAPHLAIDLHNDEAGRLHISRPSIPNLARHLERMELFENLLRKHTWFTEAVYLGPEGRVSTSLGGAWLERYGIDACTLELNCNWVAGLKEYPSARAWQDFGRDLRDVFCDYFREQSDLKSSSLSH